MSASIASHVRESVKCAGGSIASIDSWLSSHPNDPADYETLNKRRHPSIKSPAPLNKRRRLIEISGNAINSPESPRKTRGSRATAVNDKKAELSQRKQAPIASSSEQPRGTTEHTGEEELELRGRPGPLHSENDPGCTPRAKTNLLHSRPNLSFATDGPQQSTSSTTSASLSTSASTSSVPRGCSSPSRGNSPTKTDLQLSDIPVDWVEFSMKGVIVPDSARSLLKDLKRIGNGYRVIPHVVKTKASRSMAEENGDLEEEDIITRFAAPETQGDKVDPHPEEVFDDVIKIMKASTDCRKDDVAEPGWNSAVHYPLLKLALTGYWRSKGIWFQDVSTARISDSSLLPSIYAKSKKVQSKMVDYAMVIQPSMGNPMVEAPMAQRIRKKLREAGSFSINHTDARYVRFTPIGLSIESKRRAIGADTSTTQLGTWVSAHITKLRQLLDNKNTEIPPLPLIMIQGDDWKFMIAHEVRGERIMIYRSLRLGETESILGTYQLLGALKRIAKWIDEELRAWFELHVL